MDGDHAVEVPGPMIILAGDIGGTHSRIAYFASEGGQLKCVAEETYPSADCTSLDAIVTKSRSPRSRETKVLASATSSVSRLAFIPPAIVEAILQGQQPAELNPQPRRCSTAPICRSMGAGATQRSRHEVRCGFQLRRSDAVVLASGPFSPCPVLEQNQAPFRFQDRMASGSLSAARQKAARCTRHVSAHGLFTLRASRHRLYVS